MAPTRMLRTFVSCAAGLATTLAVLGPAPSSAGAVGAIDWGPCTYEPLAGRGVECGRLEVPVDRTDPSGPTFSLAVARYRATGTPGQRIGSLLFNPGGPGGSGLDTLPVAWSVLPPDVRDRFDLVTWDPRGVGQTTPAVAPCPLPTFGLPLTKPVDWQAIGKAYAAGMGPVHAACQAANEQVIAHLGTNESVADLEALRVAVGDPKLSYLGWSYGTRLGYDYAVTYPDRVRAMILDSPMDPTQTMSSVVEASVAGVQSLTAFLRLHPASARQLWEVRDALERQPVRLAHAVTMTSADLMSYVQFLSGSQSDYAYLAEQIDNLHTAVPRRGGRTTACAAGGSHPSDRAVRLVPGG